MRTLKYRRKVILFSCLFLLLLLIFPIFYSFIGYGIPNSDIIHETSDWILIEDKTGSRIALESSNSSLYDELQSQLNNGELRFILTGVIVYYSNLWHFRFDPSNIDIKYGIQVRDNAISNNFIDFQMISNSLVFYLQKSITININPIAIYHVKYPLELYIPEVIAQNNHLRRSMKAFFIFDLSAFIHVSILVGIFIIITQKSIREIKKVKKELLTSKDLENGISLSDLEKKVKLSSETINRIIKEEDLLINLDLIKREDRIYSIFYYYLAFLEKEITEMLNFQPEEITPEQYSLITQTKYKLKGVIDYLERNKLIKEQKPINELLDKLTELLKAIPFETLMKHIKKE
ncbi:MAG: hypothetical protein FK734_03095 [Asgard group archaeon]|nr:hypothetical protein [Asgard group archaeon]